MSASSPYRLDVVQPVCAKCEHRCDANMMREKEPWLDWFCEATTKELWAEEYNPITGVTTPAKMGHDRCRDVNAGGDCARFEPKPDPPPRAKRAQSPPEKLDDRPWYRRIMEWSP